MNPIFRWAGSKKKLIPIIKSVLPVEFDRYLEPFCGSACLFFEMDSINNAVLSDINPHLINAYKQIRRSPKLVHDKCQELPSNKDSYYKIRSYDMDTLSVMERAVFFTYLNRNCFNGVYRTNMQGKFNVPFGTRTGSLPDLSRFTQAAKKLKNADVRCADFFESIQLAQKGDLYYLDPPYTVRGKKSQGEYGANSFSDNEIDKLIQALRYIDGKGAKFILSYKNDEKVKIQTSKFAQVIELEVDRHVAGFAKHRVKANEILVKNY